MKKQVLIIATGPRKGGNSQALADAFARGAQEAGHTVSKVVLHDKQIGFCKGCMVCQQTQRCIIHDDADRLVQRMLEAEVIVFATPIYFYEMCGQMKTLLDRSNPLYTTDYQFRDIYLLAAAAEEAQSAIDGAAHGLGGWLACFAKARLAGMLLADGVTNVGDAHGHVALQEALAMGKAV